MSDKNDSGDIKKGIRLDINNAAGKGIPPLKSLDELADEFNLEKTVMKNLPPDFLHKFRDDTAASGYADLIRSVNNAYTDLSASLAKQEVDRLKRSEATRSLTMDSAAPQRTPNFAAQMEQRFADMEKRNAETNRLLGVISDVAAKAQTAMLANASTSARYAKIAIWIASASVICTVIQLGIQIWQVMR